MDAGAAKKKADEAAAAKAKAEKAAQDKAADEVKAAEEARKAEEAKKKEEERIAAEKKAEEERIAAEKKAEEERIAAEQRAVSCLLMHDERARKSEECVQERRVGVPFASQSGVALSCACCSSARAFWVQSALGYREVSRRYCRARAMGFHGMPEPRVCGTHTCSGFCAPH